MSSKPVGNTALTQFDVLVIGSGAGGGSITHVLCKAGLKVLVLEAGANRFDHLDDPSRQPVSRFANDELGHGPRRLIMQDPRVEPRTWRTSESDGDRTYVGDVQNLPKTVGGGAVHADLKMPRYIPTDFQLGTLLAGKFPGTSFADWPVTYDMLEPFYTYAEKVVGVQGIAGANPLEGPRSAPFPMPPGVPMYVALLASEGARTLGLTPFPYPMAVNSVPYGGRPPCNDCGFCSGFGCPTNAKGSPPVTTLRAALLTGNCLLLPETRVVKLNMNGAGDTVTSVDAIGPDGARVTYSADRYVLAASPIEDARLCLLSDSTGAGVGNSSGQVGRNLTFHYQTNVIGLFEDRLHGHRGRTVTHGFADFRGDATDPDNKPLGGIVELSGSEGPVGEAEYAIQVLTALNKFSGPLFKKVMRQSPLRDRIIAMCMQAEDAPQPTNRVDLDPAVKDLDGLPVPRITYANHEFELGASDFYAPRMLELLGAAGARWATVAPDFDGLPTSQHIMGTLRSGTDPTTSVTDGNGRFHDVGNLFGADGCLFPTSSGFNPTMTIMALAMRVGAAMVNPDSPEQVIAS